MAAAGMPGSRQDLVTPAARRGCVVLLRAGGCQLLEFGGAPEILDAAGRAAHPDRVIAGEIADLEAGRAGRDLAAPQEGGDREVAPGQRLSSCLHGAVRSRRDLRQVHRRSVTGQPQQLA